MHGPELRQRSPESVVAEVKALMDRYQIDRLRLVDDVDGIERDWLQAWAEFAEAEDAVLPFEALNDLTAQRHPHAGCARFALKEAQCLFPRRERGITRTAASSLINYGVGNAHIITF